MAKVPVVVSGEVLVDALERVTEIMKQELKKDPEMFYEVATTGGLSAPSLAVVLTFDRKTLKLRRTKICSEKHAAKEWNKANGVEI
jgi:hypothetical protein